MPRSPKLSVSFSFPIKSCTVQIFTPTPATHSAHLICLYRNIRIRCIWWEVHTFDETYFRRADISPCFASLPLSFSMTQHLLVGQGFLIVDASWLHSDTPHPVGLLWTSDQLDSEPLTDSTQHSQETGIHAPGGIRTRKPSNQAVEDSCLRLGGHKDRPLLPIAHQMFYTIPLVC